MAYDANLTRVVLFGGTQGPPPALSDTWVWDGSSWTQLQPHKSPEGRWAAGLVYDPLDRGLVLFGGELVGDPFANDTWLFQAVPLP